MDRRDRAKTIITCVVFFFYILLLIKILLLSRFSIWEIFDSQRLFSGSVNLIPFQSIIQFMSGGTENLKTFAFGNVAGNIIIFVPLGFYLPLFKKDKRIITNLPLIFTVSILVEATQWIFGIGAADVDDILLNTIGGMVGILGYRLFGLIFRNEKRIRTVSAVLSCAGLPVLLYYLFIIKMRF